MSNTSCSVPSRKQSRLEKAEAMDAKIRNIIRVFALVSVSATASAVVTRATYLQKAAFRDAIQICLKPIDPGAGNAVVAFDATVVVCPMIDPTQIENPTNGPCQTVAVPNVSATAGQKNWVKGIWQTAHATLSVPEAASDAPAP